MRYNLLARALGEVLAAWALIAAIVFLVATFPRTALVVALLGAFVVGPTAATYRRLREDP